MNACRLIRVGFLGGVFLLAAGCRSVSPSTTSDSASVSPQDALAAFHAGWPRALVLAQTAVVEYRGRRFTALGYCRFHADRDEVTLSLQSTTGMTLLAVDHGPEGVRQVNAVLPDIADPEAAARQLVEDVRRIYLPPQVPPGDCEVRGDRIWYRWAMPPGRVELLLSSANGELLEQAGRRWPYLFRRWTVRYADYRDTPAGRIPWWICYENCQYGYTVTLITREVKTWTTESAPTLTPE
jgi:hypothetical protein